MSVSVALGLFVAGFFILVMIVIPNSLIKQADVSLIKCPHSSLLDITIAHVQSSGSQLQGPSVLLACFSPVKLISLL